MPGSSRVRIGADVGGTFTDVVLQSETGDLAATGELRSSRARAAREGVRT